MRFAGDQMFVKAEQNVGPADARVSEFVGKLATGSVQPQQVAGGDHLSRSNVDHWPLLDS